MAKNTNLNFTQNINNTGVSFQSFDPLLVIQVAVNAAGSNLTPGTRTFTAAGGTLTSGGAAATWSCTAVGSAGAAIITGIPTIITQGSYTVTPTATANAATVDSGSTNATFGLTVGLYKLLYTASTNDAVVKTINITSNDTVARVVSLWLVPVASVAIPPYLVGSISVPTLSGATTSGTTSSIDLLSGGYMAGLPYDANGKRIFPLKGGYSLYASVPAVTAGTFINILTVIEEY